MIRLEHIPMLRGLLLACTLGVALSGCASDGRLDLKKLDLSKLKQPDWLSWDRKAPGTTPPVQAQNTATPAPATPGAATPQPVNNTINTIPAVANGLPRPKPWRPVSARNPIPQAPVGQRQAEEVKEQPAKAPQGKVTTEAPQALAVLPPPGKAPRTDGKGGYTPDDLVGLDGPSVERLLGKPDLSRKEPFAEVWQYAHGDCVLFLFIYAQDGGVARVTHAETGARDGGKNPEPGQCIGAILARNAATPG